MRRRARVLRRGGVEDGLRPPSAPSGRAGVLHLGPSGLEVRASTNTPAPGRGGEVERRAQRAEPEVRRHRDGVAGERRRRRRRTRRRRPPSSSRCRHAWRRRSSGLLSSRAAASTASSTATPREPCRSKNAACGLSDGDARRRAPPRPSARTARSPARRPAAPRPPAGPGAGRCPTQSGPWASMAAARRAPNGSATAHARHRRGPHAARLRDRGVRAPAGARRSNGSSARRLDRLHGRRELLHGRDDRPVDGRRRRPDLVAVGPRAPARTGCSRPCRPRRR